MGSGIDDVVVEIPGGSADGDLCKYEVANDGVGMSGRGVKSDAHRTAINGVTVNISQLKWQVVVLKPDSSVTGTHKDVVVNRHSP